jgi:hypothetical protein
MESLTSSDSEPESASASDTDTEYDPRMAAQDDTELTNLIHNIDIEDGELKSGQGGDVNIVYLACQHGASIVKSHSLFPIFTNFKKLIYYGDPYHDTTNADMHQLGEDLIKNPKSINGKFYSNKKEHAGRSYIHAPPLVMVLKEEDQIDPDMDRFLGVWKLVFHGTSISSTKILNQQQWAQRGFGNFGVFVTQSILLDTLSNIVRENGDNVSDVSVGIFSCMSQVSRFSPVADLSRNMSYRSAFRSPVIMPDRSLFLDALPRQKLFSLAMFKAERALLQWEPLAWQSVVGCGLNVLAYHFPTTFSEDFARCTVTSLPKQGTSIFYMYTLLNRLAVDDTKYLIIRSPITEILYTNILSVIPENAIVVVKMYDNPHHKGGDSHTGHIISFTRRNDITEKGIVSNFYLVDPQAKKIIIINTSTEFIAAISTEYGNRFSYMDFVLIVRDRIGGNRNVYSDSTDITITEIIESVRGKIVKPLELYWGGKQTKNKNKRTKNKRTNKRTKKR